MNPLRHGALALFLLSTVALAAAPEYTERRAPCLSHQSSRQPFFGDLHVHTRYSLDASTQGTRTTPEQAYRFARGESLGVQPWKEDGEPGRRIRLGRPLDFAAVTDHAELFGEVYMCNTPGHEKYGSWECRVLRGWPTVAYYLFNAMSSMLAMHLGLCGAGDLRCNEAATIPWADTREAAEKFYDRSGECAFTTFVGYEWTGMEPLSGGNLHRNVVFRNAVVPPLPITFIDEPSAQRLWHRLDAQCNRAGEGCESLAIPHNSNLSAGFMFDGRQDDGGAMSGDYAELRQRFEPLMEIMQKGGASECYFEAALTQDELCAFEQQAIDNVAGYNNPPDADTGFARKVLLEGMAIEDRLSVNPYRLGFVASTDTHLGAAGAVAEGGFIGHGDKGVPAVENVPPGLPDLLENNPGGLAVLWAEENSRDALFEALRRRETYATSGPRIVSRFFGGWNFTKDLCDRTDRVERAYAAGVPMGGQLEPSPGNRPAFLVMAAADTGTAEEPGTPLQRVQIIKGWITAGGDYREKVIDVAGAADNGASIDASTCTERGTGAAELCAVWTDPDFRPEERAYYYSRVLENPSCRWSQRICVDKGVDCGRPATVGEGLAACCYPEHRKVIQERAWSSPIWYSPPG